MEIVTLKGDGKDETSKIAEAINSNQMRIYPFRSVGQTTSSLTDDEHRANIRKGIKHCLRGDVFQVVISRRFEQHYEATISIFIAHCDALIPRRICSTLISEHSESSDLRPRPITEWKERQHI